MKKNIHLVFNLFLLSHLVIWTLIPFFSNKNLPLDVIEALAWGSNLDWGFEKHPPLSAFFPEMFYQLFGNQDWAYYLLSQIFIILSFIIIFKLAKKFLKNEIHALISVFLLEAIYFYNFTTPEFNVNVCQIPFWSLTIYYSWESFKNDKIHNWVLLGFFAALGVLSKYLFIYLLIGIKLFFIYHLIKNKKFNFKYFIPIIVFLLVLSPHLSWLVENNYKTIAYGLKRTSLEGSTLLSHFIYPLKFIFKQAVTLLPFFILLSLILKKFKFKFNQSDEKSIFLIFISFVPILLMLITSLIFAANIRTMWMTPFYLFFGVLIVYIFQAQINLKRLNSFISAFLILFIFSPLAYAYISITETNKRTDYLGKEMAIKTQYAWDQDHIESINVVLGDEWVAGNLSYHLKSRPVWEGLITKNKLNTLSKFTCIDNICVGSR